MFCIFGFEGIFFITTDPFPISGQIKSFVEKSPAGLSDRGGGADRDSNQPPPKGMPGVRGGVAHGARRGPPSGAHPDRLPVQWVRCRQGQARTLLMPLGARVKESEPESFFKFKFKFLLCIIVIFCVALRSHIQHIKFLAIIIECLDT